MQERYMNECSNCGNIADYNLSGYEPGEKAGEGINITDEQAEEMMKKAVERGEIVICGDTIHLNLDMI